MAAKRARLTSHRPAGNALFMVLITVISIVGCDKGHSLELTGFTEEVSTAVPWQFQQYQFRRSAHFLAWQPGTKGLLYRDGKRIYSLDSPGGSPQLYHHFRRKTPAYVHIGQAAGANRIFFTRDHKGLEDYQVYSIAAGGRIAKRHSHARHRSTSPVTDPTGRLLVFKSNLDEPGRIDLFCREVGSRTPARKLLPGISDQGRLLDWSADSGRLLVTKARSVTQASLYLVDIQAQQAREIRDLPSVAFTLAQFLPGSDDLLWVSNEGGDYQRLFLFDAATGLHRPITPALQEDIIALDVAPDGASVAFATLREGQSAVYWMVLDEQLPHEVPELPIGVVTALEYHPKGAQVAIGMRGRDWPAEVFSFRFPDNQLLRWTNAGSSRIGEVAFSKPRLFYYPTFDSLSGAPRMIPAFQYRPVRKKGPFPVVVNLHGGPESQALPVYSPWKQWLVNELGVVVIEPNFRGSAGYGTAFLQLDDGMQRTDVVQDIGALLDWIAVQPDLDARKVLVSGESYGGYLALASAIDYPDRLRAVICGFGVGDWVGFLSNTRPYRRGLRRAEFGDERQDSVRRFLQRISPLQHTDRIACPVLLLAGQNDPRVPLSNFRALVEALDRHGKDFKAVLGLGEGHGFVRKANVRAKLNIEIDFIREQLLR